MAVVVLAAGSSRRMHSENKLLSIWRGKALLRRVAEQALKSNAVSVYVITGYEANRVASLLADMPVTLIHNQDYKSGMAGSLNLGISSLDANTDGVLVCLGDMPQVTSKVMNALIAAYCPNRELDVCIPTHHGQRGNPILIGRRFFSLLTDLQGDIGARQLIRENPNRVVEVPVNHPGILLDIDTPESLSRLRKKEP
jgi:molybdenum cofactor cytidylyltransferase